jgi:IS1 family transposase|tara:strand:+ start:1172 stop:1465 length:294 start_codon:yes stop_codon:yes gene_type:complete
MRITDIEKSFIHFPTPQSGNSWRVNIQSILNSKNNTFYLLKECRSETINEKPYTSKRSAYEFLSIVESEKIHYIRTRSIERNNDDNKLNSQFQIKKT